MHITGFSIPLAFLLYFGLNFLVFVLIDLGALTFPNHWPRSPQRAALYLAEQGDYSLLVQEAATRAFLIALCTAALNSATLFFEKL